MEVQEIIKFASSTMLVYLAPAMLLFAGLMFADRIAQSLIDIVRAAGRAFRI